MSTRGDISSDDINLIHDEQFSTMRDSLGEDFLALINMFFTDCENYSARLKQRLELGDAGGFSDLAHEIKGSAGLLGLEAIANCANDWEELARHNKLPAPDQTVEHFQRLVIDTKAAAKAI